MLDTILWIKATDNKSDSPSPIIARFTSISQAYSNLDILFWEDSLHFFTLFRQGKAEQASEKASHCRKWHAPWNMNNQGHIYIYCCLTHITKTKHLLGKAYWTLFHSITMDYNGLLTSGRCHWTHHRAFTRELCFNYCTVHYSAATIMKSHLP